MFWLGLLLAVCYVPGYTGASIPTQWAVLSILLPLGLWRKGPLTSGHKLLFGFVAYALLSLLWVTDYHPAVRGLWTLFIWCLCFHLGTLLDDLSKLWKGLAIGISVSTCVALAQALDYAPVQTFDLNRPSGLFFNSSLFGVTCGLVLVALVCHRLWWLTPPLALGLILSDSRGGFVVLAIGLLARYTHWLFLLACIIVGTCAFVFGLDLADLQRMQIWGVTLRTLTFFGHGVGSYSDLHYINLAKELLIRPEFAHNDPLQLFYEFGIAAIIPITLFGLALANRSHPDWPVAIAFVTLALFFFPIYAPLTAFIGFVVAGSCIRDRLVVRSLRDNRRPYLVPWLADRKFGTH